MLRLSALGWAAVFDNFLRAEILKSGLIALKAFRAVDSVHDLLYSPFRHLLHHSSPLARLTSIVSLKGPSEVQQFTGHQHTPSLAAAFPCANNRPEIGISRTKLVLPIRHPPPGGVSDDYPPRLFLTFPVRPAAAPGGFPDPEKSPQKPPLLRRVGS